MPIKSGVKLKVDAMVNSTIGELVRDSRFQMPLLERIVGASNVSLRSDDGRAGESAV